MIQQKTSSLLSPQLMQYEFRKMRSDSENFGHVTLILQHANLADLHQRLLLLTVTLATSVTVVCSCEAVKPYETWLLCCRNWSVIARHLNGAWKIWWTNLLSMDSHTESLMSIVHGLCCRQYMQSSVSCTVLQVLTVTHCLLSCETCFSNVFWIC